jgi:hypothetical protein
VDQEARFRKCKLAWRAHLLQSNCITKYATQVLLHSVCIFSQAAQDPSSSPVLRQSVNPRSGH